MWGLDRGHVPLLRWALATSSSVVAWNAAAQEAEPQPPETAAPEAAPAEAPPAPQPAPAPPPAYAPYAYPPPYEPPPPAVPEEPGKSQTSGLAFGAGLGYQFAGIGGQLIYYLQLAEGVRIAPYAGAGVAPSELGTHSGYAFGLMASFGGRHRGVVDVGYGLAAVEGTKNLSTDEVLDSDVLYGVTIAGGYEFMADGGFFVRPTLGATIYTTESRFLDDRVTATFCIALGYKFF